MGNVVARWVLILGAAVAAVGAGLWFGQQHQAEAPAPAVATGLMGMALPDAAGKEQRMDQWKGKVLVVNFWATWCAPCREEMPEFIKAQTELGGKGVQFVGIAVDQADKVALFEKEIGLNYPSLVGGFSAMELSRSLGNKLMALPFTVIVDRNGTIVHTQLGMLKPDKLEAVVKQLL